MTDRSVHDALAALAEGRPVVVVDDEDRENEADLILAAEHATPEAVAYFLEHTSGLLCVSMTPERALELELELMVRDNTERHTTAFLVTVDYLPGTSTGISAGDRSSTIRALADPEARPGEFARPGHVMPLRARPGGVLQRAGHTEAGVDLCRMAGLAPTALLCEIVTPDRSRMVRTRDAAGFAAEHGLAVVSIADLVRYRRMVTRLVERTGEAQIQTPAGTFRAVSYRSTTDATEHVAFVAGDVAGRDVVLLRVHSECLTGDVFGSMRCDCGTQLQAALRIIAEAGRGAVVSLRGHEGRGIGLGHKLQAYQLQQHQGLDTVDANIALGLPVESRDYGVGAQIVRDLGIRRVRLITNNPSKYNGLAGYGISIVGRVGLPAMATPENVAYLETK